MSRSPSGRVATARPSDEGYTLIELMVVMAMAAVLLALAVMGVARWAEAEAQAGSARTLQTVLRQAQVRAVTEGVSVCVDFDTAAGEYRVYRYACDTTPLEPIIGPFELAADQAFGVVEFSSPDGSSFSGVTFKPSGTAWPGSVTVNRAGSGKEYRIDVEGLTGRVDLS